MQSEVFLTLTKLGPPVVRLSRVDRKAMTRQALLETARRCFAEYGYVGASLDRISGDAGYTKGAVYAHFASKEDLFLALLADGLTAQIGELEAIVDGGRNVPTALLTDLAAWLENLDRPGDDARADLPLLGLELQVESRRNPAFASPFNDVIDGYRTALREVVVALLAIQDVDPRIGIDQMAGTLVAITEGLALSRAAGLGGATAPTSLIVRILLGLEPAGTPLKRPTRKTGTTR